MLREVYQDTTNIKVGELIEYLENIGGKGLRKSNIAQTILKVKWKQTEIEHISRCHIQSAILYLNFLNSKKELDIHKVQHTIAEIVNYVKVIDNEEDISFIISSTNTLPTNIHYGNAKSLFFNQKLKSVKDNYDSDILVLYGIRLSLEQRIHGILGIDYVNSNDRPIPLSKLIEITKSLKNIEFNEDVDWERIIQINKWVNHFIHRNLRPHPWMIFIVFTYLDSLLNGGKYLHKDGRITISINASTIVHNDDDLTSEILEVLNAEFNNVIIKWSFQRDVLKL